MYVASAESDDDSIYNVSRPKTKKNSPFNFVQEEQKFNFFLLVIFKKKKIYISLAVKTYRMVMIIMITMKKMMMIVKMMMIIKI